MSAENEPTQPSALDDMLADLGFDDAGNDQLRSSLTELRASATEVPVASPDVVALLQGTTPIRRLPHGRVVVAVAAGALAFGGASAAAATNNLPDPIQEAVAKVTGAPHPDHRPEAKPVKPTDAPNDAPGQLTDKGDEGPESGNASRSDNSRAPGQIQKATKPDPADDGPAKPADPGSHGRARAYDVQFGHTEGNNKKDVSEHRAKKAKKPRAHQFEQGKKSQKFDNWGGENWGQNVKGNNRRGGNGHH
jgi:hypothetical protein